MEASVQEWLQIVARWIHVIAAIMWVGDSFLFMWMDSHLSKPRKSGDAALSGEIWLVHSGGFYEIYKRKYLRPDELPPMLYWFKWESYTTWISGIALLIIVYFMGDAVFLVDPYVRSLAPGTAIALSLGLLAAGWLVYDTLATHLFKDNLRVAALAGWPLAILVALGLGELFAPRAAYLQLGAMLGTIMTANVFFRIIPGQRHMLAATKAGTPVDTRYGVRAKQRSTHNHFMTLPVLFIMLSNHFPSTYGHPLAWLVLALLVTFGVTLKILMNRRSDTPPFIVTLGVAAFIGVVMMTYPKDLEGLGDGVYERHEPVDVARVQEIIAVRCVTCHAQQPTYPAFPSAAAGVRLDSPAQLQRYAERILMRVAVTKTMPLGNLTGMSDAERVELGAWVVQGASIAGATNSTIVASFAAPTVSTPIGSTPAEQAQALFSARCSLCHGATGRGDGIVATSLTPRPRDYHDAIWQSGTSDDALRKVILEGGAAVGKSPLMPANPALTNQPAVLNELVKIVRGFGK